MSGQSSPLANPTLPGSKLATERMPGHWLLARLGKRVLRPGGLQTTRWLIDRAAIDHDDDVVELAPGMGITAALLLSRRPRSYAAVERDRDAARIVSDVVRTHAPANTAARVLEADATDVPLADGIASVVIGEAMLSMQSEAAKERIVAEAARVLRPGGLYAIHELALTMDDERGQLAADLQRDLSRSIHVGVRIHSRAGWVRLLEREGFQVEHSIMGPMRLLEPGRLLRDEGLRGLVRFCANALRQPGALGRVRTMRDTFRRCAPHLAFIAIVARRAIEWELVETRLEERDGGTWVAGLCSNCREPIAVRMIAGGPPRAGACPNGHRVRVRELHSAGASNAPAPGQ